MSKLYQISEEELVDIERLMPEITSLLNATDPALRTKIRRIKTILSDVRWEHQPWQDITVIPSDQE